jgi:transcriptional regulator with XRE-family HTH domain
MITAAQIRAARALLNWTRQELSKESGVPHSTIADYETGRTSSMLTENAGKLVAAFAKAGVEFTDADKHHGAGLRWKEAD